MPSRPYAVPGVNRCCPGKLHLTPAPPSVSNCCRGKAGCTVPCQAAGNGPGPERAIKCLPSPHISPPFYCGRRSARRKGAYSLQPARRSVGYAFAVFRSVSPVTVASRRRRDERRGDMRASPHISPPFYCARRSARRVGAYSLQPARRSVSYAFAVFRSVPPSRRHPDALATNGGEICGLARLSLTALLLRTPICSPCRGVLPSAGST